MNHSRFQTKGQHLVRYMPDMFVKAHMIGLSRGNNSDSVTGSGMYKILFAMLLSFLLIGCSTGQTSTQSVTVTPQATIRPTATTSTLPSGTILYQADWSHGLADWQGPQMWKVVQGNLQVETSDASSITVPYKPTVPNYAIEMRIQIVRQLVNNGASFEIFARPVAGKDGYYAQVADLRKGPSPNFSHPLAEVLIDPLSSQMESRPQVIDYEPRYDWHTYRIEVQGPQAAFFIDDHRISLATSQKTPQLSNGPIGLMGRGIVLQVSNFRITAL